ncbi:polyhydroxyalkanoic acid system family protein [Noviherbaspirillum galbum]|uniref:Polyhydroxyalkanoic acid system protein n=1 Tax=Noviherbaspirillum galbum TaxID=2709383 RepID=A0A6B3SK99_9BURK|nr:polyhydroxyalkanoic acid system family protein [Noviherbaspirillum galbum]NEX61170.1 polyhydroxyalkanoic acid system protein [Noviherbaspirillum galbum]
MADISIKQKHKLSQKKAKDAAQQVADQMAEEYEMTSDWDGDVLYFRRSGVSGSLTLGEQVAHLEISLGFLLKAFAPTIEEKVTSKMKKVFSAKA